MKIPKLKLNKYHLEQNAKAIKSLKELSKESWSLPQVEEQVKRLKGKGRK